MEICVGEPPSSTGGGGRAAGALIEGLKGKRPLADLLREDDEVFKNFVLAMVV